MILSILIFLPVLGVVLVALFPQEKASKTLSLMVSLLVFVFALPLYTGFDLSDAGFQFKERADLVPRLGIHYSVGIDGISLWLVLLAAFITPLVVLGSFGLVHKSVRGYYASILLLESSVIGTLVSTDLFLFYLFWELMLIPAFFLIGLWGGPNRARATVKFVLFTMLGSLLMLVSLLYITHEVKSFDYETILSQVRASPAGGRTVLVLPGLRDGFPHQGPLVPVPRLAAGRLYGGPSGRDDPAFGGPGETRRLRVAPFLRPAFSQRRQGFRPLDHGPGRDRGVARGPHGLHPDRL